MNNFNGINPWINMLNILNAAKNNQNNPQNQGVQINQNMTQEQYSAPMPTVSANVFTNKPNNYLNPTQNVQNEQVISQDVIKMNNEVVQKYMQSLLNMPESVEKFLNSANIKDNNIQGYQFLKIFIENMLNNKELSQLLNQNSNDAIQKLLNVITQTLHSNSGSVSQLKELLSVLSTIHSASSTNTTVLRELFLLYIPINYQVFNQESDFAEITSDNSDAIEEGTLSILFETYNFSNILVILYKNNSDINIEIRAEERFPFERFKNIIKESIKESTSKIFFDFVKIKEYGIKSEKQNFKVISDEFVSINMLNVAYSIIKALFKMDSEILNSIEE